MEQRIKRFLTVTNHGRGYRVLAVNETFDMANEIALYLRAGVILVGFREDAWSEFLESGVRSGLKYMVYIDGFGKVREIEAI